MIHRHGRFLGTVPTVPRKLSYPIRILRGFGFIGFGSIGTSGSGSSWRVTTVVTRDQWFAQSVSQVLVVVNERSREPWRSKFFSADPAPPVFCCWLRLRYFEEELSRRRNLLLGLILKRTSYYSSRNNLLESFGVWMELPVGATGVRRWLKIIIIIYLTNFGLQILCAW